MRTTDMLHAAGGGMCVMRVELVALDKVWARDVAREDGAWAEDLCSNYAIVAPFLEDAADAMLAILERTGEAAPWRAYLVRAADDRAIVGICSLTEKGGGQVAIGYHTFPPYQRKGYARAMIAELSVLAFSRQDVIEIVSDTPPRETVAAAVLRGQGFDCTRTVTDTRHGCRWEWILNRNDHAIYRRKPLFIPMVRAGVVSSLVARQYGR
jgi:RimJ/RimL family protein N-acetyltransferase